MNKFTPRCCRCGKVLVPEQAMTHANGTVICLNCFTAATFPIMRGTRRAR